MIFSKQTIKDVPLAHKTVLVRADYNVPLADDGTIHDDLRIRASLPTLRYLCQQGCKVVVVSHLGRPKGTRNSKYSLKPVACRLGELLGEPVEFVNDCVGDMVARAVQSLPPGRIVLLENVRFYKGEEANDMAFAHALAQATEARYFVQDGFGVVHRAHATTAAITHLIPAVAGLLLEKEVLTISQAMVAPKRPLVAVMGGAKVSDKITVIERFVESADKIIIGGAMANTFLAYRAVPMGKSKVESGQKQVLDAIYAAAVKKVGLAKVDEFIILPKDVVVAPSPDAAVGITVPLQDIEPDDIALDAGDVTITTICKEIAKAHTIIWNGTLGLAEKTAFRQGSARLAQAMAANTAATTIIGGGDTADFVLKWDKKHGKSFSHVSTGGGASLELMAGHTLPGVEALLTRKK